MSHSWHSPIERRSPVSSRSGRDSWSSTSCTCLGSSSSFSSSALRSESGNVPHFVPRATAKSTKASRVEENTFVDATPSSAPASASTTTSLSRPMVESATLTNATVRTRLPSSQPRTARMLATASSVSPEFEMTITTSPGRHKGWLYLNSEAYCTSTAILAMCSIRYSATRAACQEVPQPTIVNLFLKPEALISAMTSRGVRPAYVWESGKGFSRLGMTTLPPEPASFAGGEAGCELGYP
mmetsp:Transcript_58315/g.161249  ORF Transcript_58315/g.161249 Transcript_58315/m.161249 type:complete len:240 (+) Transcript_58315:633-1352(+)